MNTIKLTQGDSGYALAFNLQNSDGTAFDLTGATAKLNVQLSTDPSEAFSGTMTVNIDPTTGGLTYTIAFGDFPVAGQYRAQIAVTLPGNGTITFTDLTIEVAPAIPVTP